MARVPFTQEEEVEEVDQPRNEIEEVVFELHNNWPSYRGHAVPMVLVDLVKELRRR